MSARLLDEVRRISLGAREVFERRGDSTAAEAVDGIATRLDEPLRVAFAGKVKAGKSTVLNALVGEELAPTDAGECTKIVTWYRDSHTYAATIHLRDGVVEPTSFSREGGAIDIDLKGRVADDVAWLDVAWPSTRLSELTLIDTPGLGSANVDVSARTHRFLSAVEEGDEPSQADAVIYLMRHLHRDDIGFLEAFHDDGFAEANPISTLAVLSRADELGACRREAMTSARRIAQNYRSDPRLRRLCQTVVPVAGLVAQTSMTLTEAEYRNLRTIAEMPAEDLEPLLVSVDRFASEDAPMKVAALEREELLDRLGLYGVRVAVSLCRLGAADTAQQLADELRAMSGIEELRQILTTMFAHRRDVLKARSAMAALDSLLRADQDPALDDLRSELERVSASAHEFNEVQLLNSLRSGALEFTEAEVEEIEQLLGSASSTAERLGTERGAERAALLEAVERWQIRAENPLTPKSVADAARVVIRSYEGMLAEAHTTPDPS